MDTDGILKANENLTKRIEELEKENNRLLYFKERCIELERTITEQQKQLRLKRTVIRIIQHKDNITILPRITKVDDTPKGMFIEIE
jgi:hypothetical protein